MFYPTATACAATQSAKADSCNTTPLRDTTASRDTNARRNAAASPDTTRLRDMKACRNAVATPDMARLRETTASPDLPREECGLVGVFNCPEAAKLSYLALYALQHRGQENAGIASADHGRIFMHKGDGLVADVFTQDILDSLPGRNAIGHVRYSTTG